MDALKKTVSTIASRVSKEAADLSTALVDLGQGHLFEDWDVAAEGAKSAAYDALTRHLVKLDGVYPGGLRAYVTNARTLLAQSAKGLNPFEGWVPSVPKGDRLEFDTDAFTAAEARGMEEISKAAFVLVAGGLGERLGYGGIKIELPLETTSGISYLEHYCRSILALQARARITSGSSNLELPLAIMTSGDTHDMTVKLLNKYDNFGMSKDQLTIVKQEKVPALVNNDAAFVLNEQKDGLVTKPHGHGDIHILLAQYGVAEKWAKEGREWLVFFQDTNGLVFRAVPAAIGVSASNSFHVNSLTVPRAPGEAVGGICRLVHEGEGKDLTVNVEYNQLDPLLRATTQPEGDVAAKDTPGVSPFPGNINVLVFNIQKYAAVLARTGGSIPEFVNPKYKDEQKTLFKKPTRLECMMQEYPKLLGPEDAVGFTQMPRWLCFSAVKNNIVDAAVKCKKTGHAESAASGESDYYALNRKVMASFGVKIAPYASAGEGGSIATREFSPGIPMKMGAAVVLMPSFGTTVAELRSRFPSPASVNISDKSSLILDGDISIEQLELNGSLSIRAAPGSKVVVKSLSVSNSGNEMVPTTEGDSEPMRIRGYRMRRNEMLSIEIEEPGLHVINMDKVADAGSHKLKLY